PIDLQGKQKDFSPVAIKAFTWGKTLYAVQYAIEAVGLIYNKDLVPHPPKTWNDLVKIGAQISDKTKKRYGFAIPQPDPYHTFHFMSATGGYVFGTNTDGTLNPLDVGLNNKGAVRGVSLLLDLIKKGIMPTGVDYPTMMALFKEGKLGMMVTGPWAFGEVRAAKVNYGFTKIPTIDGKQPKPFVGVQGFMISSFSKNKILAKAFLNEFVATKETMQALFAKDPRPSAYLPVATAIKDPDIAGVFASAEEGIPMPAIPEMASVWTAWSNALELIWSGKQTPQQALDEAVAQIIATIKKNK
ncbi:MAG: maltose ABC transporter substrate-binding protein, partial [Firmicutes bacterium]|nr:maltose ABC transporter substrate-binding protein [Bacillota bacterium]